MKTRAAHCSVTLERRRRLKSTMEKGMPTSMNVERVSKRTAFAILHRGGLRLWRMMRMPTDYGT
eukprot:151758-Prymnesium_polylepis.1